MEKRARRPRYSGPPPGKLDRGVLWSLFVFLLSFPGVLIFLSLIAWVADVMGVELGSSERVRDQQILNAVFLVLALVPFSVSAWVGWLAWRRRGQKGGLVIAVLAALSAVGLILLPSLA